MTATIFKIERLNTHNGPGFRTVIYFKGCPLHCSWCHNPEGIQKRKQVWVNHSICIACGSCIEACQHTSVDFKDEKININQNSCTGCQDCAEVCPTKAIEKIGKSYTVEELMKTILKDKFLFETSGGGVTVTGGEPGLYPDFITELFRQCKANNIQTAFDTSGCISPHKIENLISFTDILFLDLKILEEEKSLQYTGLKQEQLSAIINWLQNQKINPNLQVEFRTPLIPGLTDNPKNLYTFAKNILVQFPNSDWELCMFNDLCEDKYLKLNLPWQFSRKKHTSADLKKIETIRDRFPEINIKLTGFIES